MKTAIESIKGLATGFGTWTEWRSRERLSSELDVPPDFDLAGIYLLARLDSATAKNTPRASHLAEGVIYIGQSCRLIKRGEWHEKAALYRKLFPNDAKGLYTARWCYQDLTSWDVHRSTEAGLVCMARLLAVESQLIAEYGEKFGALPLLDGRRRHLLTKSLKST